MHFESVSPSAVRSIRQQDFLKVWFRLLTRTGQLPSLADFEPSRIEDEKPELMYYGIVHAHDDIRYPVTFAGQRLIEAYGFNAVGRDLQDILSPAIWSHVEPLYDHCVLRAMPVYSVFTVVDVHNDVVAYERLLLPFGEANVVRQRRTKIGPHRGHCAAAVPPRQERRQWHYVPMIPPSLQPMPLSRLPMLSATV